MPLKLDTLVINIADFKNFRDISVNTDGDRLSALIREAQMREIRDFLGEGLYHLLVADYTSADPDEGTFATPRFEKLWYGDEYEQGGTLINFNGLKPAHIYYAYERFVYVNKLNVTRYGNRVLEDGDLSVDLTPTKKYEVAADSFGLVYQNDAMSYLRTNATIYPELKKPNHREANRIGLKMFKVGRPIGR